MDLTTIRDLGAFGVILVSFFSVGVWLLRIYLPQQRVDFQAMLFTQRTDLLNTLKDLSLQFNNELQSERNFHKGIQHDEKDARQQQIEEIKLEILALTKEVHRSNLQFSQFITIWIGTLTDKPETILSFFDKLNKINGG